MAEGKVVQTRETRRCSDDVTQPAGAPREKLMGSEPAWRSGLAVEEPEENRDEPLKNRRHCEEPDSKLAACKTETEENHGERGAARSSRRESRLGSRACDGNQVENGKRRRRFTRKGKLKIVGAKPSENRKWNAETEAQTIRPGW
jgi:hypothetical protein